MWVEGDGTTVVGAGRGSRVWCEHGVSTCPSPVTPQPPVSRNVGDTSTPPVPSRRRTQSVPGWPVGSVPTILLTGDRRSSLGKGHRQEKQRTGGHPW